MTDDLLKGVKSTLLIPQAVTTFDGILSTYVKGAKSYADSILDDKNNAKKDPLYKLTIIYLSQFYYLNRDNSNVKQLPITIDSLLNRLKDRYMD